MKYRAWVLGVALGIAAGCGPEDKSAAPTAGVTLVPSPPAAPKDPEWPSVSGTWTQQASGTVDDLTAIAALDADHAWVADATGRLWWTQNGGTTWEFRGLFPWVQVSPFPPPNSAPLEVTNLQFVDEWHGWALGPRGAAWTSDGGLTWTLSQSHWKEYLPDDGLSLISPTTVWLSNTPYTSYSADGGQTWTPIQVAGKAVVASAITFVDSQIGWMVSGSKLHKTLDQGQTWQLHAPLDNWGAQLTAVDDTHAWVLANGYVYATSGEHDWMVRKVPGSRRIQFVDPSRGWVVGKKIHRSTDGGATWTEQTTPYSDFKDFAFVDASIGWVVGDNGLILKTVTGGQ